jgi:hypothetical protein
MRYPSHITDQQRIDIGKTFIKKRTRKLYKSLDNTALQLIDNDIDGWQQDITELEVRDFWDSVYAFKLETARKYWVNYLTAENVDWTLEEVALDDVDINWPRVGTPTLRELFGSPPYTRRQINSYLDDNPEIRESMTAKSDEYSQSTQPRDDYPVVGLRSNGRLDLEDGNRRVLRKILCGETHISAYVGTLQGDKPTNYWISTGWFWQLVLLASRSSEDLSHYRHVLHDVFRQSPLTRTTYELGVSGGYFGERNKLAKELLM